jgi:hypothetical protein
VSAGWLKVFKLQASSCRLKVEGWAPVATELAERMSNSLIT